MELLDDLECYGFCPNSEHKFVYELYKDWKFVICTNNSEPQIIEHKSGYTHIIK